LKHNFLADIVALFPKTYSTTVTIDGSHNKKIAQFEQEITILKAEKAVLIQVIGNK
jgi:hypothetical protein